MPRVDSFLKGGIPFLLMLINMVSPFLFKHDWYRELYYSDLMSHSLGTSIGTHIVFIWFYFRKKFCAIPKCCVIGLIIMTCVSLFTPEDYYNLIYDFYIGIFCFSIGFAMYIDHN